MHPLMQVGPEKRTTVQVQLYADPWATVTGWAKHHKWKEVAPPQNRLYVVTRGWGNPAPQNVAFFQEDSILWIQAWLKFGFGIRLRSLFMLPAELNVSSGGRAVFARKAVRGEVNELLAHLNAPPIS